MNCPVKWNIIHSIYVIRAFYRDRQAGGAIITFPRDNANDNSRVCRAAFALRATDKFLITRINWPDCNCRCACYRRLRRGCAWSPTLLPLFLSCRTKFTFDYFGKCVRSGGKGRGARLNARAFRIRGNSGPVRAAPPAAREIQEVVMMRPIRQIFSWLMTRKRFCRTPPPSCKLPSDRAN